MGKSEESLQQQITNLEAQLSAAAERERRLNEMVRYYKGRIDMLIHSASKEGKVIHVFGQDSPETYSSTSEDKFRTAKRRFASLYHPDTMKHTGTEKMLREQIFKEFWDELEAIERAP